MISSRGQITEGAWSNHLSVQPELTRRVQAAVVHAVVVPLGQELGKHTRHVHVSDTTTIGLNSDVSDSARMGLNSHVSDTARKGLNRYVSDTARMGLTLMEPSSFSCSLRTLCTIGMSRPSILKTTISPTL